ncbi:MAG: acyltransferase family protein [Chloroflexota bacterium]
MTDPTPRTLALDGLRGIAVIAVVIEHAWPHLLPGGFAGVDMFFVLSGYLITGLLVRELSVSGRIDLISFYARRVRRIVPASLACVVGIWVGYTLLLGPSVPDTLPPQALSATFSVSNFYFARSGTGYFDADPSSSPYLHFWSLAVEEQFYLVWPTALLVVAVMASRLSASPTARCWIPVAVLVAAGLVSLALALWTNPTYAFYLLPQRGWELIVGGLLAWTQGHGLIRLAPTFARWRAVGVVAGVVLIVFVLLTAPSLGRWPGPGTVLVVVGTALLVAGGDGMPGARALRTPPLRFMGRISYSLYLWHWPLIAAAGLMVLPTSPATDFAKVIAVVVAIGLATASTLWMEEPIRVSRQAMLRGRKAIGVAVAAMCLVGLSIATLTVPLARVVPGVEPLGTALVGARDDRERIITDACRTGKTTSARLSDCLYGTASRPDGSPTHGDTGDARVAVLFGDSHASHWFPAVNAWAKERGLVLVPLLRAACSPVDAPIALSASVTAGCQKWRAAALDRIRELKPVVTFTSTSSASILMVDGVRLYPRGDPERWIAPAVSTFRRLAEIGPTVFLGDVPRPDFSIPDCLGVHRLDPATCARDLDLVHPRALVAAEAEAARAGGVWFLDPGPSLCPDRRCTWIVDGRVGWVDEHHLSSAAVMALLPMLEPLFDTWTSPMPAGGPPTAGR